MKTFFAFFAAILFCASIYAQPVQNKWYADREEILHSPASSAAPLLLSSVEADQYVITMDIKWLPEEASNHVGSDIRVALRNSSDVLKYRFRFYRPDNNQPNNALFALEKQTATEPVGTDNTSAWETVASVAVKPEQIVAGAWHNLFVTVSGKEVSVKWDDATVLTFSGIASAATKNDLSIGVNKSAVQFRNIQVSSIDRFLVYMTGIPESVANAK